jgi:hypothetical protein
MPISGLTLEASFAAFGGVGFLSFRPRPPRLSESDGGQAGRTKEQLKSPQSLAQTWYAMDSFQCFRLATRKAIPYSTNYVAPGQACLSCLIH